MTRSMAEALATAQTASPRKGAECVILVAKDGTRAGFTTWSKPLPVDLGFGDGPETCAPGINLSALTLACGFDASNCEIDGPLAGDFARAKILGGKWRGAAAWLVRVSPDLADEYAPLLRARVAESRVEGRKFVLELRNAADAFNQSWGRVLSPYCSAEFGDSRCKMTRTPIAATVTAVQDSFRFTVDLGGDYADRYFALGKAAFLTGELAGTDEAKVFDYDGTGGAVELYEPLIAPPAVGDTLNLYRDCSKLLKSDDLDLPTCLSYDNVVNFRGFPEVPGNRFYYRVSAPGSDYA